MDIDDTMKRTYKYRIYPKKDQVQILDQQLWLCKNLYNVALDQRRNAWKMCGESISYTDQANELPDIKATHPEFKDVHSQVLQDVLRRLDKAMSNFFRRAKQRRRARRSRSATRGSNPSIASEA